jgi:IS30 family transposase
MAKPAKATMNLKAADLMARHVRGESHGSAKLTEAQVRQIRRLHREGAAVKRIAEAFGVSTVTVQSIIQRKSWKHVRDEAAKAR